MVKITKSALTMLLSHYRAIFKHAYVKGLASAVVCSALTLGATAQATVVDDTTYVSDQTISGESDSIGGAFWVKDSSLGSTANTYEGNTAAGATANAGQGGAIAGWGSSEISSDSDTFTGNRAAGNPAKDPNDQDHNDDGAGGAIYGGGNTTVYISEGTFTGNIAGTTTTDAEDNVIGSKIGYGGALVTLSNNTNQISYTTFTDNYSVNLSDSAENAGGETGGAWYNVGTVTLSGVNTFSGNYTLLETGSKLYNDIFNEGTITIDGGTTILESGYVASKSGVLNVTNSAVLVLNKDSANTGVFKLADDGQDPVVEASTLNIGPKATLTLNNESTSDWTILNTLGGDNGYNVDLSGNLNVIGKHKTTEDINLVVGGTFTQSGTLTAGGDVLIVAGGDALTLDNITLADGKDLEVESVYGALNLTGTITINGSGSDINLTHKSGDNDLTKVIVGTMTHLGVQGGSTADSFAIDNVGVAVDGTAVTSSVYGSLDVENTTLKINNYLIVPDTDGDSDSVLDHLVTFGNAVIDASSVTGDKLSLVAGSMKGVDLANTEGSTVILDGTSVLSYDSTGKTFSLAAKTSDSSATRVAQDAVVLGSDDSLKLVFTNTSTFGVDTVYIDATTAGGATGYALYDNLVGALYSTDPAGDVVLSGITVKKLTDDGVNNQAIGDATWVNNEDTVDSAADMDNTNNTVDLNGAELTAGAVELGVAATGAAGKATTDKTLALSNGELSLINPTDEGNFVQTSAGATADVTLASTALLDVTGRGSLGSVTGAGDLSVNNNSLGTAGEVTVASLGTAPVTKTDTTAAAAASPLGSVTVAENTLTVSGDSYVEDVAFAETEGDAKLIGASSLTIGSPANSANTTTVTGYGTIAAKTLNVGYQSAAATDTTAAVQSSTIELGTGIVLGSGTEASETVNLAGTIAPNALDTGNGGELDAGVVNVLASGDVTLAGGEARELNVDRADLTLLDDLDLGDLTSSTTTDVSTISGSNVQVKGTLRLVDENTELDIVDSSVTAEGTSTPSSVAIGTLDINGGTLLVDPSVVVVNTLATTNSVDETLTNTLKGDLIVGEGSAVYVGALASTTNPAALDGSEFTETYVDKTAGTYDGMKVKTAFADSAVVYLDVPADGESDMTIAKDSGIIVDSSIDSVSDRYDAQNEITVKNGVLVLAGNLDIDFSQANKSSLTVSGEDAKLVNHLGANQITAANIALGTDSDVIVENGNLILTANKSLSINSDLYIYDEDDLGSNRITVENNTDTTVTFGGIIYQQNGAYLNLYGSEYIAESVVDADPDYVFTAIGAATPALITGYADGTVYDNLEVQYNAYVVTNSVDLNNITALRNYGRIDTDTLKASAYANGRIHTKTLTMTGESLLTDTDTAGLTVSSGNLTVTGSIVAASPTVATNHVNKIIDVTNYGTVKLGVADQDITGSAGSTAFNLTGAGSGLTVYGTFKDLGAVTLSGEYAAFTVDGEYANAVASSLTTTAGDVRLYDNAKLAVTGVSTLASNSVAVDSDSELTLGQTNFAASSVELTDGGTLVLDAENVLTADLVNDKWVLVSAATDTNKSVYRQDAIIGDATSVVQINGLTNGFDGTEGLDADEIEAVLDTAFSADFKGSVNLGKTKLVGAPETLKGSEVNATLARTAYYADAEVTHVDPSTGFVADQAYNFGNVVLNNGTNATAATATALNVGAGSLYLNKAGSNGNFVTASTDGTAANAVGAGSIKFTGDGLVKLSGGGNVMNVTTTGDDQGTVLFDGGTSNVEGTVGSSTASLANIMVNDETSVNVAGDVYAGAITATEEGDLQIAGTVVKAGIISADMADIKAPNADITTTGAVTLTRSNTSEDAGDGAYLESKSLTVGGALNATASTVKTGDAAITGRLIAKDGSSIQADSLKVTARTQATETDLNINDGDLTGGLIAQEGSHVNVTATDDTDGNLDLGAASQIGSTTEDDGSTLKVANLLTMGGDLDVLNATVQTSYVDMDGNEIFLDPALFYANKLVDNGNVDASTSTMTGSVVVGAGSGFFVGNDFANVESFGSYVDGLKSQGYTAVAYIDDTLSIASGKNLIIDGDITADNYDDYFTADDGEYKGVTDSVVVADGGYLKLTNDALYDEGGNQVYAVQFAAATADVVNNGVIDLSDIDFTVGTPISVFSAGSDGDNVTVTGTGTTLAGNVLYTTSWDGGDLGLDFSSDRADIYLADVDDSIANPIRDFAQGVGNKWIASSFVSKSLNLGSAGQIGSALNSAARVAVLGGAAQSATLVHRTLNESIEERQGFLGRPSSTLGMVKGTDVTVWLTPNYGRLDGDFSAGKQGRAGANSRMWGVTMGIDVDNNEGFTVGTAFQVGHGKSDGRGDFASTKADFNYWGLSLYGAYTYNDFKVIGDISYSKVKSDISQRNVAGSLDADVKSAITSVGITAKYEAEVQGNIYLTPQIGVRYNHFKADSYDVKYAFGEKLSGKSFDADYVTFPIGVSISKGFRLAQWYLKPTAYVGMIALAGNDDVKTKIVSNDIEMSATSKINNRVVFRGRFGLDAQYKNFGLGIGYGYLGGSHTSSHNFNLNARYTF